MNCFNFISLLAFLLFLEVRILVTLIMLNRYKLYIYTKIEWSFYVYVSCPFWAGMREPPTFLSVHNLWPLREERCLQAMDEHLERNLDVVDHDAVLPWIGFFEVTDHELRRQSFVHDLVALVLSDDLSVLLPLHSSLCSVTAELADEGDWLVFACFLIFRRFQYLNGFCNKNIKLVLAFVEQK